MDQKKIGAFIARRRKELDMTQKELAEKLGITDRAVSKWETGRSMPDLSLLQPLSHVLKIDVNDLLNGAIISEDTYRKKSGENLISLAELNRLKSFRYGYIGFYPLAILLLIYCCRDFVPYCCIQYGCLLFQISDDKRCNVTYYCYMRDYWYSGMPDGICRENMVM